MSSLWDFWKSHNRTYSRLWKKRTINRRDEMTKLFLYLLNNEPDGKILNKKEINNFKKIFIVLIKIL